MRDAERGKGQVKIKGEECEVPCETAHEKGDVMNQKVTF